MEIRSARNPQHLIVNVSIQIPFKTKCPHRSHELSLSPSPNHKKKYKLVPTPNQQKKTAYTSNLNTLRDLPYHTQGHPSRKKQTAPTPNVSSRAGPMKMKSAELSPRSKMSSRRSKQTRIIRNISILQKVTSEEDNIIKYTTASNELKEKIENMRLGLSNPKMDTHMSEVDIVEIRNIETQVREGRDSQYTIRMKDILRTACAKKIQRAWRNHLTRKLIKSYSNDIRKKDLKRAETFDEMTLRTARSQGGGLKLKMKNTLEGPKNGEGLTVQTARDQITKKNTLIQKFHEESIEKWEQILSRIRNQKNIDKLLEISLQRTQQLRSGLDNDIQQPVLSRPKKEVKIDFFEEKESTPNKNKIIKTKGYYQQQREKRRQLNQRSIGSLKREQKVNYFQNQMLKIENDESDFSVDSLRLDSVESDNVRQNNVREKEQLQNIKLRKKLQIFKEHLPQIIPFGEKPEELLPANNNNRRVDLASIMKKKYELESQSSKLSAIKQESQNSQTITVGTQDIFEIRQKSEQSVHDISNLEDELSNIIQTHRQWKPSISKESQSKSWLSKLSVALKKSDQEMNNLLFQELILEALIEISQSEKLIGFIKEIYQKSKKKLNKPQGIITSLISIKQYLNYFINYLYQYQLEHQLQTNLLKPIGPTPSDVLKYFRGEDLPYDPDTEYVMSIKTFNEHWQMANEMIYFDPKWEDPNKERERVIYLKQLTKVFFRAIFDCFNESLQFQRLFGMRGKPYPWSQQSLKKQIPSLKKAVSDSFQRVVRVSSVFCGVHFADKQHSLDAKTMEEIQQENIVKLLIMQIKEDEQLWNFYEDELVQTKLEVTNFVEQSLILEIIKFIVKQKLKN